MQGGSPDRSCMRAGSGPSPGSGPFLNKGERGVLMYVDSIYSLVALVLTMAFGLIGAVQLVGPWFVREAYKRWDYGPRVRIVTGLLDVMAAIMLALPAFRGWGIGLAAVLTFGSVVVFLNHRQYRYALPAIGLLIALVPAAVAVPRPAQIQFIAQKALPANGSERVLASDEGSISKVSIEQPPRAGEGERRAF
jgi:hypothetical protein